MKKYIGGIAFVVSTIAFIIGFEIYANWNKPEQPIDNIPYDWIYDYYHPDVVNHDTIVKDTSYKWDYTPDCPTEWWDEDTINILSAIMFVESSYNDSAYRASEDAVGCLQIRKCMVNDVNRILKRQKSTLRFTYNSRWSRDSSIQMFEIYCNYYNLITAEEIARCWNGGPRGINNPATVGYWEKVKDKINS